MVLLLVGTLSLMGCADDVEQGVENAETDPEFTEDGDNTAMTETEMATAQLIGQQGNALGMLRFTSANGGVSIEGSVQGIAPGEHGLHIHQEGVCDPNAADGPFTSAGGHWDPMNTENHGGPDMPIDERHMGDLGNITVGSDSTAQIDEMYDFLSLSGDTSIVGHAVMIHGGEDDLETNPAGDAGPRVACGVIEMGGSMGGAM